MPRSEQRVLSATRGQAVGATTAVAFAIPTAGVMIGASGNLVGTLSGDSSPITFNVVQGMLYPLSFQSIDATSAVPIVALFNVE